jgi:hypothetical protein
MNTHIITTDLEGKVIKEYNWHHGESGVVCTLKLTDSTVLTWMGTRPVYVPFVKGKKYKDWEFSDTVYTFKGVCYLEGNPYFLMENCDTNRNEVIQPHQAKGYTEV